MTGAPAKGGDWSYVGSEGGAYKQPLYKQPSSQKPKMENSVQVWIDPIRGVVKVKAPFNANFNTMNRALEGRAWIPSAKLWEFNIQALPELLQVLEKCYSKIERPPLELLEIFEGFDKEDLEIIYRAMLRTKNEKSKELIKSFFKNYINIVEAQAKLGRMIRTESLEETDEEMF